MCRKCFDRFDWGKKFFRFSNMGRFLSSTTCQLQISLFILACCFTCLTGASLTVEQRLQALEATNVEIKQFLVDKNERLQALETEVQQLKFKVIALQNERNVAKNGVITTNNQPTGKNTIFRTCHETYLADPSLTSGMHWIDPDGQGVGDDPIQVHCDMITRITSVLHHNEQPTDVGHCADPGCFSKLISYSATIRQMITLAELSSECHQSISVLRLQLYAPFETNDIVYSWWNDRNGNPQYFWAGSNSSVHTCQCGIDHNCLESTLKCNCDSTLPIPEFDNGVITNKDLLPVTRLNFGRTLLETSSGVYTLGRFECSGQLAVNGLPSSCTDLWRIGHTLNGLYSVMGAQFVEALYCDFNKLSSEPGFQTKIGHFDVKSLPVYFFVQSSSNFEIINTPITYGTNRLNIGGAMNPVNGIFTAPRPGRYFFSFSAIARRSSSSEWCHLGVGLMLNGNQIGVTRSEGSNGDWESITFQSTLDLKTGDRVWCQIVFIMNAYLFADSGNTLFTGSLLEEDL